MKETSRFLMQCASLFLGSVTACAEEGCPPKPCCVPTCCPEIIDCCECNVCPPNFVVTPNGGPCVKNGLGLFLTADFIYWTAREDSLDFAITHGTAAAIGAPAHVPRGHVFSPEASWHPGFKAGIGYDFCYDGWDIFAEYTWYRLRNTTETAKSTGDLTLLDAFWFVNNTANSVTQAFSDVHGKWMLDFNVLDIALGRNFYVSPRLMLRPFCGIKAAFLKQKLNVNFQRNFTDAGSDAFTMDNHMQNWAVGLLTGVDSAWHFCRSFSMFAKFAASAIWEQFKRTRHDNQFTVDLNQNFSQVNLRSRFHIVRPVFEWMLGVRWEIWFLCDAYHFWLEAGWEQQVWFSQDKFIRLPGGAACDNGDLTLQGLTVQARFDF